MGSGATAKYALPFPLGTDTPNEPADFEALANAVDNIFVAYEQDLIANRPAVGKTGRLFTQTDGVAVGTTWRDSGAEWRSVGSRVQANAANDVAQVVRGFLGQTADLWEAQDSLGNVKASVDNGGAGRFTSLFDNGNRVFSASNPNLASTVQSETGWGVAPLVGASTLFARADHTHGTPPTPVTSAVAGAGISVSAATGAVTFANTGATSVAGRTGAVALTAADIGSGTFPGSMTHSAAALFNAGITVKPSAVGSIATLIQMLAGQTADPWQLQDSTTAIKARINTAGSAAFAGTLFVGSPTVQGGAGLQVNPYAANVTGAVIQAFAGQTSDLFQTQDSAGAVLTKMASNGDTQVPFFSVGGTRLAGVLASFISNATGTIVKVAKGVSGQTADLFQAQNNSGTAMARITAAGAGIFGANGQTIPSALRAAILGTGASPVTGPSSTAITRAIWSANTNVALEMGALGAAPWDVWVQAADASSAGAYYPLRLQPLGGTLFVGGAGSAASAIKGVAQAGTGQTGSIWEFQTSAGTPKFTVDGDGNIQIQGYTNGNKGSGHFNLTNAAGDLGTIGLYLRTITGQTANVFQVDQASGAIGIWVTGGGGRLGVAGQLGLGVGTVGDGGGAGPMIQFLNSVSVVPGAGGFIYKDAGTLRYRGDGGTITQLGAS